MLYFWQGRNSTRDEKGASALLTTEMDDKLGGSQCNAESLKVESRFTFAHSLLENLLSMLVDCFGFQKFIGKGYL